MRLLNAQDLSISEFIDTGLPPYAVLPHTWDGEEGKERIPKIVETARLTREHGLDWFWIDTCAIDKKSSAELSEAINSIFAWYAEAEVCFAHLSDLTTSPSEAQLDPSTSLSRKRLQQYPLHDCRWFYRGWALQELIAPKEVKFYTADWTLIGKKSETELAILVSMITGIRIEALNSQPSLSDFTVAEKFGWAANRETTRKEDIAYSLLGLFGVTMPLLYGEGDRAFVRLQGEIMRQCKIDFSIFLWADEKAECIGCYHSLPASFPARFSVSTSRGSGLVRNLHSELLLTWTLTFRSPSWFVDSSYAWTGTGIFLNVDDLYVLVFPISSKTWYSASILLKRLGDGQFIRASPRILVAAPEFIGAYGRLLNPRDTVPGYIPTRYVQSMVTTVPSNPQLHTKMPGIKVHQYRIKMWISNIIREGVQLRMRTVRAEEAYLSRCERLNEQGHVGSEFMLRLSTEDPDLQDCIMLRLALRCDDVGTEKQDQSVTIRVLQVIASETLPREQFCQLSKCEWAISVVDNQNDELVLQIDLCTKNLLIRIPVAAMTESKAKESRFV